MIVRRYFETTLALLLTVAPAVGQDRDGDGMPDATDSVPTVSYTPGFAVTNGGAMDFDPGNDTDPECKARERVAGFLASQQTFVQKIAFSVVKNGKVHFADAFARNTSGQVVHDPGGIHRLFRIGSTTKSMTSVAAKILEERGKLSLDDYVSDDDATRLTVGGKRTLRHLLSHQGAFKLDTGHIYLFGYPGTLQAFWKEKSDSISPHYTSSNFGNFGGTHNYSAFNYSLAGAYLENRSGLSFARTLQSLVFDRSRMATATFDGPERRRRQSAAPSA